MTERIAECINILGEFCGKRDLPELTREALKQKFGLEQADVMVLFGGSVLCGGDVMAEAMRRQVAKKYGIVGGKGHTTADLRRNFHQEIPGLNPAGWPEAEIFDAYLKIKHRLCPGFLERYSTNCGNNITFLLELLQEKQIPFQSIILTQDATMQLRMEAGLRKVLPQGVSIISYAAYSAKVVLRNGELAFEKPIRGMWDVDRYVTLLLGEIQRLADNAQGYGPKGANFIAHVDIPMTVCNAFGVLMREYPGKIRKADPLYASNEE